MDVGLHPRAVRAVAGFHGPCSVSTGNMTVRRTRGVFVLLPSLGPSAPRSASSGGSA